MRKYQSWRLVGVLALLLGASVNAFAQLPEGGQDADPQAQLAHQEARMREAGQQVMRLVDSGLAGLIWDHASQEMKRLVSRDAFIAQIALSRTPLGAMLERGPPEVTRSHSDGFGDVPRGFYINVIALTRFANRPDILREMVTFRFDEDRAWRVTGYSLSLE